MFACESGLGLGTRIQLTLKDDIYEECVFIRMALDGRALVRYEAETPAGKQLWVLVWSDLALENDPNFRIVSEPTEDTRFVASISEDDIYGYGVEVSYET